MIDSVADVSFFFTAHAERCRGSVCGYSLVMKISPSIFIGKPESTTEAGLTFVLLVVTVIHNLLCFRVESDFREMIMEGLYFILNSSLCVQWHMSLQYQHTLHQE